MRAIVGHSKTMSISNILLRLVSSIFPAILLSGCIGVGQSTIREGRGSYNNIIRDTNNEQLLTNIVRAGFRETLQFDTITSVAASSVASSALTGGIGNIGLPGQTGSFSGTVGYNESPIVTISPNQGYALIAQLSSPIKVSSINNLLNSNWPLLPVLDFTINDLTPNYTDFGRALNIIRVMYNIGALTIDSSGDTQVTFKVSAEGILTRELAERNNRGSSVCRATSNQREQILRLWHELKKIFRQPNAEVIILDTQNKNPKFYNLQTRSAIGVLNLAIFNYYAFLSPDVMASVRTTNDKSLCRGGDSYYVAGDKTLNSQENTDAYWRTLAIGDLSSSDAFETGKQRAYILIERSTNKPINAYVAVFRKGEWFSIADDDDISKTNFGLLSQIVTIQAVPDQPKAPTPGIVFQR